MDKGLKDIRKAARKQEIMKGIYSPYLISCGTLLAIFDEIERLEVAQRPQRTASWVCKKCGYRNNATHDDCHSCGTVQRPQQEQERIERQADRFNREA